MVLNKDQDIEIEDDFRGNQNRETSFKQICLTQYSSCCREGSKEMTSGQTRKVVTQHGVVEIMTPNQTQIFVNTVEMLRVLLLPHIATNHKKIGPMLKKHYDDLAALNNNYEGIRGNLKKEYDSIPNTRQNINEPTQKELHAKEYRTLLQKIEETYQQQLVIHYRDKLLSALSQLLSDLGYFEEGSFSDITAI